MCVQHFSLGISFLGDLFPEGLQLLSFFPQGFVIYILKWQ